MPKNITLTGMMGTGKSLIAQTLGQFFVSKVVVDVDDLIEKTFSVSIPEMFAQYGEEFFRNAETQTLKSIYKSENCIVSLGGGAFERAENRQVIQANSVVIYLKTTPETIYERIKNCKNRPMLQEDFGVEEISKILASRKVNYELADYTVTTDNKTPQAIAMEIMELINE